jgi:NADPH:quinone reductase-like Zn-dependent oxidoreductase
MMKAAIFEKQGLENLEPKITDHDVLVRVKMCGINPVDYIVVSSSLPKL